MLHRMLPLAALTGVAAAAAVQTGCESSACGGLAASDDERAPVIRSFHVPGEEQQIPGDPWTVVFLAQFEDPNQDLGGGMAEFYLNADVEPTTQALDSVFRQSGVELDEPEGTLWLTLRFAESSVADGTRVRLSLQLVDQAELRSNCFSLELKFDVYPAAQARRAVGGNAIAGARCGGGTGAS